MFARETGERANSAPNPRPWSGLRWSAGFEEDRESGLLSFYLPEEKSFIPHKSDKTERKQRE